ncbi:hypothetical protein AB0I55_12335 [Actinocatenispora sera]|uniref:hypothetical protein n=1 Tax=Actinocatenispora sera TaxID=390989 RepID=UPI0033FE0615
MELQQMRAFVTVVEEDGSSASKRTVRRRRRGRFVGSPATPRAATHHCRWRSRWSFPDTPVLARHTSTGTQLDALRGGELDVGLLRQCPAGHELDDALVAAEALGVLPATDQAERVAVPDGIRLQRLAGLEWFGFARTESPAWYDEVVAFLRSYELDVDRDAPDVVDEIRSAGGCADFVGGELTGEESARKLAATARELGGGVRPARRAGQCGEPRPDPYRRDGNGLAGEQIVRRPRGLPG